MKLLTLILCLTLSSFKGSLNAFLVLVGFVQLYSQLLNFLVSHIERIHCGNASTLIVHHSPVYESDYFLDPKCSLDGLLEKGA